MILEKTNLVLCCIKITILDWSNSSIASLWRTGAKKPVTVFGVHKRCGHVHSGLNPQVQRGAGPSQQLFASCRHEAICSPSRGGLLLSARVNVDLTPMALQSAQLCSLAASPSTPSLLMLLMEAHNSFFSPSWSVCECLK